MPDAPVPIVPTGRTVETGIYRLPALCLALALCPVAGAQVSTPASIWSFQTSAILTGASFESEPEGYRVYTALAIEVGIARDLGRRVRLRVTGALESREVELFSPGLPKSNLGSLELLPVNAVVEWHPRLTGRVRPYLGMGLNMSVFWEKSGTLDSIRVTPSIGPAVAAGLEIPLQPATCFIVGYKWHRLATDLEVDGHRLASLAIHPSTFGAGFTFRF